MAETDDLTARAIDAARKYQVDLTALQVSVERHDAAIQAEKDALEDRDDEIRRLPKRRGLQELICVVTRLSREQVRKIGKGRSTP